MAIGPRVLCIGDRLETTAEELRGAGFDVMLARNAQAGRALIHLYPPAAILGDREHVWEVHQKHPQIPVVMVPADICGKIPPRFATDKVNEVLGKKEAAAG